MTFSIGVVGVGQFGGAFAHLFDCHPGVRRGIRRRRTAGACEAEAGALRRWQVRSAASRNAGIRRRRRRDLHPALDPRPAGGAGAPGRQARLLRRAHGDLRGGDRRDHRSRPGDPDCLHDGRDQLLQPGNRLCPQEARRGQRSAGSSTPRATTSTTWTSASTTPTSTAAASTGRRPPATRPCCTRRTPSAACWEHCRPTPSASAAWVSRMTAATACSTRT